MANERPIAICCNISQNFSDIVENKIITSGYAYVNAALANHFNLRSKAGSIPDRCNIVPHNAKFI